jgi:hypothetical protein
VTPSDGTYRELEARWKALPATRGLRVGEVPCDSSGRRLLVVELGSGVPRRTVSIAAGVHGDEPAGVWALLDLVETNALDSRFAYRIWPCTNPSGFAAATRASADGVDVNRTFDGRGRSPEARAMLSVGGPLSELSLDLHEDCDAEGFYCYEYGGGAIGRRVIEELVLRGFPIDPLDVTFGLAGPLDDAHCLREPGRVVADALREATLLGGLSYSLAMARAGAGHALTFETPLRAPWESRVAMHVAAVRTAVGALLEESDSAPCN